MIQSWINFDKRLKIQDILGLILSNVPKDENLTDNSGKVDILIFTVTSVIVIIPILISTLKASTLNGATKIEN